MNKKVLSVLVVLAVLFTAVPVFAMGAEETTESREQTPVTVVETSDTAEEAVTAISTVDVSDGTVATVFLVKEKKFTQNDIDQLFSSYVKAGYDMSNATDEAILGILIQEELLTQAYMQAGYVDSEGMLTDDTIDGILGYYVYMLQQSGVSIESSEDFSAFIEEQEIDIQEVIEYYATDYLLNMYLNENYEAELNDYSEPTEQEILDFYANNASQFTNSEKVKIAHVFFPFSDDKAKNDVKALAESVHEQICDGSLTFEKAVTKYSEDTETVDNGGLLGWLNKQETDFEQAVGIDSDTHSAYHKQLFGENTVNEIFKLDDGQISSVLESSKGFHIFKCVNHQEDKSLGISDKVYPESSSTVYDFINYYLYKYNIQLAETVASSKMMSDLQNQATITYLTK